MRTLKTTHQIGPYAVRCPTCRNPDTSAKVVATGPRAHRLRCPLTREQRSNGDEMKWIVLALATLALGCDYKQPDTYGPSRDRRITSPDWTYDDADAGVRCYLFEGYGNGSGVQCARIGAPAP